MNARRWLLVLLVLAAVLVVLYGCGGYRPITREDFRDLQSVEITKAICDAGALSAGCGSRGGS